VEAGVDRALTEYIIDVEEVSRPGSRLLACIRTENRPGRLVIHACRWDRDQLLFRVTKGRESAAVDAACVNADRPVEPLGFGNRRVAVYDHGSAAVVGGPV